MHRPVGATFGFGGRLVSFVNHKQPTTDPVTGQVRQQSATITITQVRREGSRAAVNADVMLTPAPAFGPISADWAGMPHQQWSQKHSRVYAPSYAGSH
jgi:hypothetical protein